MSKSQFTKALSESFELGLISTSVYAGFVEQLEDGADAEVLGIVLMIAITGHTKA